MTKDDRCSRHVPGGQDATSALTSGLARARRRLSQRVIAIGRDLDRIDEAEAWAARAPWLVAAAARAPRGARSLDVSDWSEGEEKTLSFPLDPSRPAREQVEAAFRRARRLRRGRPLADERLKEAENAIRVLDQLTAELSAGGGKRESGAGRETGGEEGAGAGAGEAEKEADLEEIRARAWAALPHDVRGAMGGSPGAPAPGRVRSAIPKDPQRKPPFRTFQARSGLRILVGRRADLNDELTFQVSRPHHLWLHAKDHPGAHVIAWNEKGKALTESELVDAASLAAHFSEARGESIVDVTYTQRRYVRKPRRAPPGLVIADRAKSIAVRIDEAHLKALLITETEG